MSSDLIEGKNGEMPYLKANEYFMKLVKYGVTNFKDMLELIKNSNNKSINNHNTSAGTSDQVSLNFNNSINNTGSKNTSQDTRQPSEFTFSFFKNTLNSILNSLNINSLFYGYLEQPELEAMKVNINNFISINDTRKDSSGSNNSTSSILNTFTMIDYLHAHKIISQPVTFKITNDLKTEHNHIVENYFQVGTRDYKISLVMNIIEMVWGNMFYYYLRTIKQLGYIVSANKQIIDNFMVIRLFFIFNLIKNSLN